MRLVVLFGLILGVLALGNSSPAQVLKKELEPEKPPEIKWPKEIQGKDMATWVRTVRESKDASARDQALRTVPYFGPECRKLVGPSIISAITTDPDINVRLTAISMVPLIGFEPELVDEGLGALISVLVNKNNANHTKFEATTALGNCGPIAKKAIPAIMSHTLIDMTSWQNRKAAAAALGRLGQPIGKDDGPDLQAVKGLASLLYLAKKDPSHLVRREAINALILLGPPKEETTWKFLRAQLTGAFTDPDKSVALWARVAFIRTEQELIKPTDANLLAVVKLLSSKELAEKQEAIQALGVIGEEARWRLADLIAIAQGKNEEPIIIATALWSMSQMPSETGKILPVIDPLQRAPDPTIKAAAESAYKTLTEKPDPDKKKDPPPKG
jgi:HEAT repeat protein